MKHSTNPKIREYYGQLQYNVLQTALETLPTNDPLYNTKGPNRPTRNEVFKLISDHHIASLLTSELIEQLKDIGYQITKIPKK